MTARKIPCSEIEPLLDAFVDGELDDRERPIVEGHLSGCDACQAKVGEIARVVQSLRSMPRLNAPRDFAEEIDFERKGKSGGALIRPAFWGGLAAVAAIALIVLAQRNLPGQVGQNVLAGKPAPPASAPVSPVAGPATPVAAPASPDASSRIAAGPQRRPSAVKEPGKPLVAERGDDAAVDPGVEPADAPRLRAPARSVVANNAYDLADDPFTGGSVAVAILSGSGEGCTTDMLGLSVDEDGLYEIMM